MYPKSPGLTPLILVKLAVGIGAKALIILFLTPAEALEGIGIARSISRLPL